jgi:KDO2-lipid IV(A) lauroyltransferase
LADAVDSVSVPRPMWLLWGSREQRRAAVRYWITDVLAGIGLYGLYYAMRLMPIDMCSASGALATRLTRHLYPESDARARRLWKALRPDEADVASVDAAMDRLWRNVGRTMHEFSVLDRLWAAGRIETVDMDHVHRARDEGKPILVTPLHLGNWETVLIAGIASGHHGSGIYLVPENRFEHRLANASRARYGARFYAAGPRSLRDALRELRSRRGPFIIYVDEFIRGRVQAPSFGRPLGVDANLAYAVQLAKKTNAALIPAYCLRLNDSARFRIQVLPPVELVDRDDPEAELRENIRILDSVIAPIIRQHLDQWYYALDFEFD